MIAWLIALTLGVAAIAAALVPLVLDLRARRRRPAAEPGPDPREVLAPPPMVEGETLRTWLVHHHPLREGVWAEVVRQFYGRAADVPAVFSYFHGVDLEQLQRHFTSALLIVTHAGASRATVDYVAGKHADVRNAVGVPITGDIYDAVVATLVGVLGEAGVPDYALNQLATTVEPFRAAILAAPFR